MKKGEELFKDIYHHPKKYRSRDGRNIATNFVIDTEVGHCAYNPKKLFPLTVCFEMTIQRAPYTYTAEGRFNDNGTESNLDIIETHEL